MSDRVTWGGAGRNLGPPLTPAAVEPLRGAGQARERPPPPWTGPPGASDGSTCIHSSGMRGRLRGAQGPKKSFRLLRIYLVVPLPSRSIHLGGLPSLGALLFPG